jgi:hypothetical protein
MGKSILQKSIKYHTYNPDCNIVTGYIDADTFITYGIYIKPTIHLMRTTDSAVHIPRNIQPGQEFIEIYTGENYVPSSKKRSHSRHFYSEAIPASYRQAWQTLKDYYENILTAEEKRQDTLALNK